jgi:dCMP deaminase
MVEVRGLMILGIAGLYGSGKSAVVEYLASASFVPLSLSDVLREELAKRGNEETRDRMISLGNELRQSEGPGALARRLAPRITGDRNFVIDSIRHPAEVQALKDLRSNFRLLWIESEESTRLERIRVRARSGDPSDAAQLRSFEAREKGSNDSNAQQLDAVRQLADDVVRNDGSLDDLKDAIRSVLARSMYFERPGWDQYFMSIASVVASRSNCVKRKVAAVVTIDRRVVSTGYNGTPRGVRNCNEGGCPRCNSFGPGGASLSECLCSHGEENAITQAAYHGVALRGATLYSTFCPCLLCTKMIINAGIAEVVYNGEYPLGEMSLSLLREAGVKVRQVELS